MIQNTSYIARNRKSNKYKTLSYKDMPFVWSERAYATSSWGSSSMSMWGLTWRFWFYSSSLMTLLTLTILRLPSLTMCSFLFAESFCRKSVRPVSQVRMAHRRFQPWLDLRLWNLTCRLWHWCVYSPKTAKQRDFELHIDDQIADQPMSRYSNISRCQ